MHTNIAGYMINVNSIASSALSLQLSRGGITQWVERPTEKPGAMLTQVRFPDAVRDFSPMVMLTRVRFPDAVRDFSPMVMLTRVRFPDAARDFSPMAMLTRVRFPDAALIFLLRYLYPTPSPFAIACINQCAHVKKSQTPSAWPWENTAHTARMDSAVPMAAVALPREGDLNFTHGINEALNISTCFILVVYIHHIFR